MVFDSDGDFCFSADVFSGYTSPALTDGSYTIAALQKNSLLRAASNLDALTQYDLAAGSDYILKTVTVKNGKLSTVSSLFVPVLDLQKLSYTVEDNTLFTVNKSLAFPEEYVVFRIAYEIDEKYTSSNEQITITLPQEFSIASSSMTLNGKQHIYSLEDNVLTVNTNQPNGVIRFYMTAGSVGDYRIQADLHFNGDSGRVTQPIGSVNLQVVAAQMNIPSRTGNGELTISGKAIPNSTLTFFDSGYEIGSTTSNGAGSFHVKLNLKLAGQYTYHQLSALVSNEILEESAFVEGKTVINDDSTVTLSKITMINTAHDQSGKKMEYVSEFNFIDPGPVPNYWFWPGCYPEFTFVVEFLGNGARQVENVCVLTQNNSGDLTQIPCTFDEATNKWVGTHNFNYSHSAPSGVTATYDIIYSETEETTVPEIDGELILDYAEELESVFGSDENTLPDLEDVKSQITVDPDAEFTQEDQEELEALAQQLEQSAREIEQLKNELYYQEQVAWAEQGVSYTREGDTQTLELENGKIEVTTREVPNITAEELLDDGYTLAGDSDIMQIYERKHDDGTLDRVVMNLSGYEALGNHTFISTKITAETGETGDSALATLKQDLSSLIDVTKLTDGSLNFISKYTGEIHDDLFQSCSDYLTDKIRFEELILEKQYSNLEIEDHIQTVLKNTDDTYIDNIRMMNHMDDMGELAEMSSKALKPYADALGAVGTAMTINEYIGFHRSLSKIRDFLPEECPGDKDNFNYLKFNLGLNQVDQVANDLIFVAYEVLDKVLTATGIGAIPALGISVLTNTVNNLVAEDMRNEIQELKNDALNLDCNGDGIPDGDPLGLLDNLNNGFMSATTVIDPSGYVYEAVPSNRVEGVKAEAYYLGYALDEYGIPKEEPEEILWDAENYDQVNPQYTNELGMFQWDVPMGQWLLKFSKEGYYDTDSRKDPAANEDGYLPVPPPQVEVNTAIVSKAAPTVEQVNVYSDQIQVIFSQYMKLDSVTGKTITVTSGGKQITGTVKPANAEFNYEKTEQFASVFTFIPTVQLDGTAKVSVSGCVNYAGTGMEKAYSETCSVKYRPERISADPSVELTWNEAGALSIQILPAKAGANQTLQVEVSSSSILEAPESITTDSQGLATLTLTGLLPGRSEVTLTLNGTDLTANVSVLVTETASELQACEQVTANLPSGSVVKPGTKLTLQTATAGAEIYYTLDGTCPCIVDSPSRIRYTGPIALQEDTFLIAYAVKAGMQDSATAGFMYSVKETGCEHAQTTLKNKKVATCTETGYTGDLVCALCGQTITKGSEIGKAKHTESIDKEVAATCTADGKTEGTHCAVCQSVLVKQEIIPATGHKWGDWNVTKPATGAAEGEESRSCKVCGLKEARIIDKLTHPFVDVLPGKFYEIPVLWAVEKDITKGMDATHFAPDATCNRGQVVTFLWRAAGSPEPTSGNNPFTDVKEGKFYYKAVLWAVENGITSGTSATTFSPDASCTRGQVATFLWRTLGKPDLSSGTNPFTDVKQGKFYYSAVLWAVEAGVTQGMTKTTFAPDTTCTRGQIVTFLYRALG